MSGRAQVMANFSRAASEYDAHAQFQHVQTRRVLDAARMLLPVQARILDIGCGTGTFARGARDGWEVIGIDLAYGMCAASGAIQADAVALPVADASMDAVVSSLCLQWVENLDSAMAEIARVLKPGGRAIIASLGSDSLRELRAASRQAELPLQLLPMRGSDDYRAAISAEGLSLTLFEQDSAIEYFSDVAALLDSMRRIGAGLGRARGMIGAQRWKAMLAAYEKLRTNDGLPATWDRLFMILTRSSGGGGPQTEPPHPNPLPQGERE